MATAPLPKMDDNVYSWSMLSSCSGSKMGERLVALWLWWVQRESLRRVGVMPKDYSSEVTLTKKKTCFTVTVCPQPQGKSMSTSIFVDILTTCFFLLFGSTPRPCINSGAKFRCRRCDGTEFSYYLKLNIKFITWKRPLQLCFACGCGRLPAEQVIDLDLDCFRPSVG